MHGGLHVTRFALPGEGGLILHNGNPNPGLSRVISEYQSDWSALDVPVVIHLLVTSQRAMARCIEIINQHELIAGIEIGFDVMANPDDAIEVMKQLSILSEKPILARLPLAMAEQLALPIVAAGANALVVGAPPRGSFRQDDGSFTGGRVYGRLVYSQMLTVFQAVMQQGVTVPVVACGGIHSFDDVRNLLDLDAVAVQIDSALWSMPTIMNDLADAFGSSTATPRLPAKLSDESVAQANQRFRSWFDEDSDVMDLD